VVGGGDGGVHACLNQGEAVWGRGSPCVGGSGLLTGQGGSKEQGGSGTGSATWRMDEGGGQRGGDGGGLAGGSSRMQRRRVGQRGGVPDGHRGGNREERVTDQRDHGTVPTAVKTDSSRFKRS
jgi:hypothetical protein